MDETDAALPDPFFLEQFSCVVVQCALLPPDSWDGQPHVCSFIVPRQSYLYYYMDVIRETLGEPPARSEWVWYSFHSEWARRACVPLPVQYPVSVLQDFVAAHTPDASGPPGVLFVRLHRAAPTEPTALRVAAPQVAALHRHALKQGVAFCYGRVAPLLLAERRAPAVQRGLFWAVRHNEPRGVWRARAALQRGGEEIGARHTPGAMLHRAEGAVGLVAVTNTSQKLGMFLRQHVPELAELPRDVGVSNTVLSIIYVGGLQPLCSTPMDALLECLSSVDLFLHIVIKPKEALRQFVEMTLLKREGTAETNTS